MLTVRRIRRCAGTVLSVTLGVTVFTLATAGPSGAASLPVPIGSSAAGTAIKNWLLSPNASPGTNNWSCKPSKTHPYPVVLVPGTGANIGFNGTTLSPLLTNDGYCVFSLNYNQTIPLVPADGLGTIATSAKQLSTFVNKVLSKTGATQVDIVGHSQGGLMPNYYIKRLGGASKVHTFVGLAPSNHGTTASGLVTLGKELGILGIANLFLTVANMKGLHDQEITSPFEKALFATGTTVPGPSYWVISTTHTEVVTPWQNGQLKGANNIVIQNQCPSDPVGHIGIPFDGPAVQDTVNALNGGSAAFRPTCTNYGLDL